MLLDAAAPDANIVCKRRFSACKLTTTFSISSSLSSTSTLSASAFVIWPSPLLMQGNLLRGIVNCLGVARCKIGHYWGNYI